MTDQTEVTPIEDDGVVDNSEQVVERVQNELANNLKEVKSKIPAIGILNHSTNADGKWEQAVVLDKDGIPKQIDSITVHSDTSVQVYDPDNGDVLLTHTEGTEHITCHDMEGNRPLEELVDSEFFDITYKFLTFENGDRYYIIQGHNSTVNGVDINEAFRRRKHMGDLLLGLQQPTLDQLANWFERSPHLDIDKLSWGKTYELQKDYTLSVNCSVKPDGAYLETTQLLVWRMIGGKPQAELLQLDIQPANYLAGTKHGNLNLDYSYVLDEHVYKVMVFHQINDVPSKVEFFSKTGTPLQALPLRTIPGDAEDGFEVYQKAVEYFGLESVAHIDKAKVNSLLFVNKPEDNNLFSFGVIEAEHDVEYIESRFYKTDEWDSFDLMKKDALADAKKVGFDKPMVHVFRQRSTDKIILVFVNAIDIPLEEGEDEDGTSTE